jgi:hypothetical protein
MKVRAMHASILSDGHLVFPFSHFLGEEGEVFTVPLGGKRNLLDRAKSIVHVMCWMS